VYESYCSGIMLKKAWIGLILIFAAVSLFSQPDVTVTSSRVLERNDFFSGLYPRQEGSEGERAALNYCKGVLQTFDIPYNESSFQEMEGNHSFSHNLELTIPGELEDQLVIAVPLSQEENALKG